MHQRQHIEDREISKWAFIPDIIPLDRNNNLPPEGVANLEYDSYRD